MANYLNKVELLGQLTSEPSMRQTSLGSAVAFSFVVVSEEVNFRGEMANETCYVDVECYGPTAESVRSSIHSGMTVLIDGRLRMESWIDSATGRRRSTLLVVADNVVVAPVESEISVAPQAGEMPPDSGMDSAYF